MNVVLLGTGTPVTDPSRQGPATAVVVGDRAYLVDAGPGVVRQAAAGAQQGVPALEPRNLTRGFLTHLHSDHTAGLPDLVLTPWVMGRAQPLTLAGPRGTEHMVAHVLEAYREDIRQRLYGLEPTNDLGHRVVATDVTPGVVHEDDRVRVEAFGVAHGTWPSALGYRFESDGGTVVVSGDTAPCESLLAAAQGCDVLVHEVYSASMLEHRSEAWKAYHRAHHTSTTELAAIADHVRPGLLVLYHQLFWGATDEGLIAEITQARQTDGRVISGRDLDVFSCGVQRAQQTIVDTTENHRPG